jgi:hypothetical protein
MSRRCAGNPATGPHGIKMSMTFTAKRIGACK